MSTGTMRTENGFSLTPDPKSGVMFRCLPNEVCLDIMGELDILSLAALIATYPRARNLFEYDYNRVLGAILSRWPPQLRQIILATLALSLECSRVSYISEDSVRSIIINSIYDDHLPATFCPEFDCITILSHLWAINVELETAARQFIDSRLSKAYEFGNQAYKFDNPEQEFNEARLTPTELYRIYRALCRLQLFYNLEQMYHINNSFIIDLENTVVASLTGFERDELSSIELYFTRLCRFRTDFGCPRAVPPPNPSFYHDPSIPFSEIQTFSVVDRIWPVSIRDIVSHARSYEGNRRFRRGLAYGTTIQCLPAVAHSWPQMEGADRANLAWDRLFKDYPALYVSRTTFEDHFLARGVFLWDEDKLGKLGLLLELPQNFHRLYASGELPRERHVKALELEAEWVNGLTGFPSHL